jgi:hypothetical protein
MTTVSLSWEPGQETIGADLAATIAMDRAAWESAGAAFTDVDDGDGEQPGLAVGTVEINGKPEQFGILDYGDPTTHLRIAGAQAERPALTLLVIGELIAAGVLSGPDAVLEVIGLAKPATVDAKIEYLADLMQEQFAVMQRQLRWNEDPVLQPIATPVEDSPRLAGALRDLVTVRGKLQIGDREEPVEILGSGSDLRF